MDDFLTRFSHDLVDRLTGPLKFRFLLQPIMASIFAFRDGILDAQSGRPPFLWTYFRDRSQRHDLMQEVWKSVGRIVLLALAMDFIYQIIALHRVYLGEAVVTAVILAIVPYIVLRGPVNRIARHWSRGKTASRHT